jgi:hypothetical protein
MGGEANETITKQGLEERRAAISHAVPREYPLMSPRIVMVSGLSEFHTNRENFRPPGSSRTGDCEITHPRRTGHATMLPAHDCQPFMATA